MNFKTTAWVTMTTLGLTACGGGGGGGNSAVTVPPPLSAPVATIPLTSSTVSALFIPAARPASIFNTITMQSSGNLAAGDVQNANGSVTSVNGYSLTGTPVVTDLAGDATFAMGRWAGGTVITPHGTETFASNSAYHYVLFNHAQVFPTSGTLSCDSGHFTRPSYTGGTDSLESFGNANGTASLSFVDGKATANISLTVKTSTSQGTRTALFSDVLPGNTFTSGGLGTGTGVVLMTVGQADGGALSLQGYYMLGLSTGANYRGVYRFRCI